MRAALAFALLAGTALAAPAPSAEAGRSAPARVEAFFTPGDEVDRAIASRIDASGRSVHVAAYLFTNRRIASALARAAKRGVAVDLVADASQHASGGLPRVRELDRAGVRIWLREGLAAFHHKFVVVDGAVVVTGSFNFTQAAQDRNAENIVIIESREVAGRFLAEFERHRAASSRLQ